MAVEVLKARGVPEDRILFLNIIASPEGIRNFSTKFPKLRVVTAFVDQVRNLLRPPCHACKTDSETFINESPGTRRKEVRNITEFGRCIWLTVTAISFLASATSATDSTQSSANIKQYQLGTRRPSSHQAGSSICVVRISHLATKTSIVSPSTSHYKGGSRREYRQVSP